MGVLHQLGSASPTRMFAPTVARGTAPPSAVSHLLETFVDGSVRDQDEHDAGRFGAWRDSRNLFGARPDNTLLVKASYWLGR